MRKQFLIGLAVAAIAAYSCTDGFGVVRIIALSYAAEAGYAPQASNEREIKVTATLQNIPNEAEIWDFQVIMETHTKALNDDLTKSLVLIADGKQYLPVGWEGAPPGGHHRKGLLRFKAIAPQPRSMELQIRLTDDASPRSFKWLLK
ncbi:MAG: hypothetical protein A2061_07395 [Gallionellales bacterium GWA2_59_43]|nr:MAG: hypothetical protein A2061_07395 [Gallionellales bacterium GWA2_59_43]